MARMRGGCLAGASPGVFDLGRLFAITREAFFRGFVLQHFSAVSMREHDRRPYAPFRIPARPGGAGTSGCLTGPGPGRERASAADSLNQLRGRWLPVRELRLDEVDVFGVQANLSRDARGEWIWSAPGELERSAGPRPSARSVPAMRQSLSPLCGPVARG
jgi:hypothetical protein